MWFGSSTIVNNIMSGAITHNNSVVEKHFHQKADKPGNICCKYRGL